MEDGHRKRDGHLMWPGIRCEAIPYVGYPYAKGDDCSHTRKHPYRVHMGPYRSNPHVISSRRANIHNGWLVCSVDDPVSLWLRPASMPDQIFTNSEHSIAVDALLWDHNIATCSIVLALGVEI